MEMIRSLKGMNYDLLFEAFSRAFQDYELQLNQEELERMLKRRGFIPELSFGSYRQGKLVSFTFNGIGTFKGEKSAYDTGTGTLKEYRGSGLASGIFKHSIPFLQEAGVSQYILEVLQHNSSAVSVYRKLGFEVIREFNYFTAKHERVRSAVKKTAPDMVIRNINLDYRETMSGFWDFEPSWQNSFESISRDLPVFILRGAFQKEQLLGYAIFEPLSGDITQIAVDKGHRRKGIGCALLKDVLKYNQHSGVKMINTDINCLSVSGFAQAVSLELAGQQFEMRKPL